LVLEIGMDKAGEIDHLAQIINPDVAVITQIGQTHLQNFKNTQEIALAKAECIKHSSKIIFNKDINCLSVLNKECLKNLKKPTYPQISICNYKTYANITNFKLNKSFFDRFFLTNNKVEIKKPLTLKYLKNILLVYQVLIESGLDIDIKLFCLIDFDNFFCGSDLSGRGSWIKIKPASSEIYLIDESYNASPTSMSNAIQTLELIKSRKAIVIGDMLELGSNEIQLHKNLLEHILRCKPNLIVCVGGLMRHLYEELLNVNLGIKIKHFTSVEDINKNELLSDLQQLKIEYLLVKSSNSTGLKYLVEFLKTYKC
jgi:UDP-N-acetylmuramoyl-tripeptide--D-alanyl-D-alanine ligase